MKQSYFMCFYILSICMIDLQATAEVDEGVHKKQPSLRDENGYIRYRAATEFSALAVGATDSTRRRLIGALVQPFLKDPAPAVCWETIKAFVVLATNAENSEERLEVLNILWGPLGDEDSTVNQEAAKGMLVLVNRAEGVQECQSIRERLTLTLEKETNYRVLYTIAQMFGVLASKTTNVDELRLIAHALCAGFLKPNYDWRVIEIASHAFEVVCKAVDDSERLRMKEILRSSLRGKNQYVCELVKTYWP